ncbi:sensor histidine kinase [Clostridium sp. 19966]|uniref:sensor histidine kinase n=1 Tax=Clostridium sp. 19966 TaxID=2768166 RepID=UPI0028DDC06B|nr:sensor histidine kinase [Clostridium sp. 19966]MDT8717264.1 sensor histidine kinase [Clostridium sp. 19966]
MIKIILNKHPIDNISVKNKLLLIYILCAFLPVIFTNTVFLKVTSNNVKNQQLELINSSLQKTKLQLYKDIDDGTLAAYTILTDQQINNSLERNYISMEDFYDEYNRYLRDSLQKILYMVNQIGEVNIYTNNPNIPNSSGYQFITDDVKEQEWYKYALSDPKVFHMIAYESGGNKYFSLIKVLNYFNSGQKYNKVLKIDFSDYKLQTTLDSEKLSGQVYLLNDGDRVVCTTDQQYGEGKILPIFDESLFKKSDTIIKTDFDKYSQTKGWQLALVVNEQDITTNINESKQYIYYLCIINLLFAFVIIQIISSSFKYRLKILTKHIKKVRKQNFEIVECNEGRDEIGEVIREFNRMTLKINELIRDVYEEKIQKKNLEIERRQAEINALQSQINPHFLFNVLESIRMRSVIKKETETAQIIKYVSKMFRRLLQWENDMITIKEETEYIEDFLKIEKYRFGDKIDYEMEINQEALYFNVPKMIFQPLVENACAHGIERKKDGGKVSMKLDLEEGKLICIIEDNGTGIEDNKLKDIISNMHKETSDGKSIGIKNVYNRLKLIYDDKFTFKIESVFGQGTRIVISIPTED